MRASVIVFPGSNCDRDAHDVLQASGMHVKMVWHGDSELPKSDVVVVPGGFSYGDYLRSGAMAAHSPIMQQVKKHAENGGKTIGICNGFQVLTECGLLPGVLMRNKNLKFVCKNTWLKVETVKTPFTKGYKAEQVINVPVAHHDGNYFCDEATLKMLQDNDQIVFRYCTADGSYEDAANPNGSIDNIAGICNEKRNVVGMMPHPERHAEVILGGVDGRAMFTSLLAA